MSRNAPARRLASPSDVKTLELGIGAPIVRRFEGRPHNLAEIPELQRSAVYVLVFDNEQARSVYVGMSCALANRIASHERLRKTDKLARLYVIQSKDHPLSGADAKVLEGIVLAGVGLTDDLVELLNRRPPFGRPATFERYCALRSFAGAALLLLARDPLLKPTVSLSSLLGGAPGMMTTLGLLRRSRSRVDGKLTELNAGSVKAKATIFRICVVLHAGSTIDLEPSGIHHLGGWVCQLEARFDGFVEAMADGAGLLKTDLRFETETYMAGFVRPSRKGQLHYWSHRAEQRALAQADALTIWRRVDPNETDPVFAETLAKAVQRLAPLDRDWPKATRGDVASAIAVALRSSKEASLLSTKLDIAVTGLLACAMRGDPAAQATLHDLQRRFSSRGLIPKPG